MRCPSGTYKSANYSDSFERAIVRACTVCPLNTSSPAGSVSKYDCACSPGFTGPNGGPCSACPVGWFKNAQGTEACTTCTEGSFLKPRGEVEHFAGWKLNGPNVLGYPKVVAGGTYAQDGSAATATFYAPKYIAVTPDGAQLFVLETKPTTIRSIDLASGEVSTFVKPTYSFQQNGGLEVNVDFALCWAFSYPCPMTITSDGSSLLVGYHRSLSRIDVSSGQIYNLMYDTTVFVTALAISPDGDTLYFFDKTSWSLMSLDVASGEKNRLGVPNHSPGPSNGPLAVASFSQTVNAMVVTPDGNTILVADGGYHLIRSVDLLTGQVSTVAGGGTAGGTLMDGTGTAARFYYPSALSLAPSGKTVYVTDQFFTKGYPSSSCAVRRVDLVSGTVSTLAGGQPEGFLDGAGTSASFGLIYGVAVTPDERTVLVSDQTNRRIRAVSVIAQCESCPSHSTSSSGMTSCLCDAGYTGLGTTSSPCYPCPAGTFKETTGSEPCTACPPNSFSEEIGAISSTTCVALCNPGYAGPVGGPCDECAADFYSASSTASSTACRPCFSGSSSPPGSSSLDQCTCPIGEYAEVSGAWISGDPYSAAITDGAATSAGFKRSSGRSAHSCIAINRNGDLAYALTASTGGKIRVIDLATGSVSTLPQQTSEPLKIADSNDGSTDRECGLALTDDDSTLLVSSSAYHVIQRVSVSTGQSSFLAGCTAGLAGAWGTCGGSNIPGFADGSAQADPPQYSGVRFYTPTDVAVTPDGATAIVADMNNHRVRSIDLASQEVSTLAGNGKGAIWYGYVDGDASSAQFHLPRKVRVSPDGKRVFVLERVNSGTMRYNHIRVIDMVTRKVSLLAGCVTSCAAVPTDGIGTEATFNMPLFMDISRDGTRLIVLDYDDFVASRRGTVRSVNTTSGQVTTLLSSDAFRMPIPIGASDNVVVSLSEPSGIALAPDGNSILVFSRDVSILLNISLQVCTKCPRGTYSSLTGATACISCPENTYSDSEGATSVSTCVPCPAGTSAPVGSSGCLCNAGFSGPIGGPCTMCGASFYSQSSYSYVEQIRTQTGVSCVPCQPTTSSPQGSDDPSDCECSAGKYAVRRAVDSFAGLTVSVAAYGGILVTKDGGKLLMADYSDNKVHLIDMASGNMSTLAEGIKGASGMAMSPDGDSVVVASRLDHRIRLIEVASGTVSILAGGTCGYVDGVGTLAKFCYPNSLAIAPDDGTIFVMDRFGVPKIRQIDFTSRLVTTLALRDVSGLFSIYSYADSIAVMPDGSALVVADYARHLIWMVDRSSLLSRRLVGGGSWQESDGIGTNAGVYYPKNVAVTPDGATIVFTSNNKHSIRFIDVASSVVSTPLSPLGVGAGFQDGYGTEVRFSTPQFLTVAPDGSTVFVLDAGNNKIRTISLVKCTCRGDDTCVSNGLSYANDGQCDEARYDGCADNSVCSAGTDATDCSKCAISCEA
jgi:DNA-binding beta-propeller fold protein YncE